MATRADTLLAVYNAVRSTNETLPARGRIASRESEVIVGEGAKIESLGFVTLMVAVAQEIEAIGGSCPNLVEEILDPDTGVTTLGELADYLIKCA